VQGSSYIVKLLHNGVTQDGCKKCTYKRLSFLTVDLKKFKELITKQMTTILSKIMLYHHT